MIQLVSRPHVKLHILEHLGTRLGYETREAWERG